ncbi:hypothetical protein [Oleispirillum naphthae]|uniref:hypothetical protein n=1 Tax=Oleispirillum naphthae TaxID=2838853 RepID=UPI00308263C7
MTVTLAWERRLTTYSEIVFCSDSRLSGGGNIDVCQKLFPLPREDAAIGFCGSTLIAYPLINQFISYIKNYKKNIDRALDGSELPRRFAALANKFLNSYIDPVDLERELLETSFLIGCFSWRHGHPIINKIRFDNGAKQFVASSSSFPKRISERLHREVKQFGMIGDLQHQYYQELGQHIDYGSADRINMEPFCALNSMLNNPVYTDRRRDLKGVIGGAPQLLKVYPFFRTIEFAVHWPDATSGRLFLNGREVFDFEKIQLPQLDARTLDARYPLENLAQASELTPPDEDMVPPRNGAPESALVIDH